MLPGFAGPAVHGDMDGRLIFFRRASREYRASAPVYFCEPPAQECEDALHFGQD
jgi:hypothetical protein